MKNDSDLVIAQSKTMILIVSAMISFRAHPWLHALGSKKIYIDSALFCEEGGTLLPFSSKYVQVASSFNICTLNILFVQANISKHIY
jgi:hypothetical protein